MRNLKMQTKSAFLLLLAILFVPTEGWSSSGTKFTVNEMMWIARNQSYVSRLEGQRAYEARLEVRQAFLMLQPALTIDNAVSFYNQEYASALADQLGFLFPSGWYNWRMKHHLAKAQAETFQVEVANQIQTVEGLSVNVHLLQTMQSDYQAYLDGLLKFQTQVRQASARDGNVSIEFLTDLDFEISHSRSDLVEIEAAVRTSQGALAQVAGVAPERRDGFEIVGLTLPTLEEKDLVGKMTDSEKQKIEAKGSAPSIVSGFNPRSASMLIVSRFPLQFSAMYFPERAGSVFIPGMVSIGIGVGCIPDMSPPGLLPCPL